MFLRSSGQSSNWQCSAKDSLTFMPRRHQGSRGSLRSQEQRPPTQQRSAGESLTYRPRRHHRLSCSRQHNKLGGQRQPVGVTRTGRNHNTKLCEATRGAALRSEQPWTARRATQPGCNHKLNWGQPIGPRDPRRVTSSNRGQPSRGDATVITARQEMATTQLSMENHSADQELDIEEIIKAAKEVATTCSKDWILKQIRRI
ncbi:hypothetical protein NDU88_003801 [Pleurodeles waltl]|uniref:Uncharacterized protein n=1 Tax=Pleurodeles waltl TaxID=8319 RepID=A0AAV7KVZ2_PLEWA|nr:hypothetical protein NDU88_003801 [Pleurodeles waltl]